MANCIKFVEVGNATTWGQHRAPEWELMGFLKVLRIKRFKGLRPDDFFGETWWHHMGFFWQLLPKHLLTSQRNALESFWIHAELHPENTWHLEEISEKGEQDRHDDQESDVEEIVVEATQTKQYQCEPISTSQPWGPCILLFEFQELVVTIVCTTMQIIVRKL